VVELATPNGTNNLTEERIKRTKGRGRPSSRSDERETFSSGRMRNCCSEYKQEQSMSITASESWKTLPEAISEGFIPPKKRVYKAIQVGDKRKATSLQG